MDKQALIELAKSFGRFIYFGLLGLISVFLTNLLSSGQLNDVVITVGGMTINLAIVLVAAITGLIKLIDRYRHVSTSTDSKGIAPKFLQN